MFDSKDKYAQFLEQNKEAIADYRDALSRLASTPDGEYVFRKLYLASGMVLSSDPDKVSARKLDWWEGRRDLYLTFVRGFLKPEQRNKIERITNE